jgi:hypothetical protein
MTRASAKARGAQRRQLEGGESYPSDRRAGGGGYGKLSRNRARVDPMPRFLLARAYQLTTVHESRRAINHRRWITGDGQGG